MTDVERYIASCTFEEREEYRAALRQHDSEPAPPAAHARMELATLAGGLSAIVFHAETIASSRNARDSFMASCKRAAAEVAKWPEWKRALSTPGRTLPHVRR